MSTLLGTSGPDSLVGTAGNDTLYCLQGQDTLRGGAGNDLLDGGPITDRVGFTDLNLVSYSDSPAAVVVNLAAGNAQDGWGGTDTLLHIDVVVGSAFSDLMLGSSDADMFEMFEGLAGNDTIDGGALSANSANRVSYRSAPQAVTVNLGSGWASDGYGSTDTLFNINQVRGSAQSDTLLGSDRSDFVEAFDGLAGDDHIDGRGGSDRVRYEYATTGVNVDLAAGTASDGQGGNDTLIGIEHARGSVWNDTLAGDDGGNSLEGGAGNDLLLGRDGSDTLQGGAGDDTLDGGSQRVLVDTANESNEYDLAVYSDATGPVTVALGADGSAGSASGAGVGTDLLIDIEFVIGSSFADSISGSNRAVNEIFRGGAGNDTLRGGAASGTDLGFNLVDYRRAEAAVVVNLATGVASGGDGSDVLQGMQGVLASPYADLLVGDDADNYFDALPGEDSIQGGAGFDRLSFQNASGSVVASLATGISSGADGNDQFSGIEALRGSAHADTLSGGTGDDELQGRDGSDRLSGNDGADTLHGGWGDDQLLGDAGADSLIGDDGGDRLFGGSGDDTLEGGAEDDTLSGGAGNDRIDGGTITDLVNYTDLNAVDYADSPSGIVVNLAAGTAQDGWGGSDTLFNLNWVIGSNHADLLQGSSVIGLWEMFDGGAGNDTIDGGAIVERAGNRVTYQNALSSVSVDLAAGFAAGTSTGTDTLRNINQVRGTPYADSLTGSDTSARSEDFEGLGGNDTIDGRGGIDTVRYESTTGGVTVDLTLGTGTDGRGGTDTLIGIENVKGSPSSDVITGNAVANQLEGRNGNDQLRGEAGSDTLQGGSGNDTLDGGSQRVIQDTANLNNEYDIAVFSDATGPVTVALGADGSAGSASGDGIGIDLLIDIEMVIGSAFDDVISGSNRAVNEIIRGGAGDDTLRGGAAGGTDLGFNLVDYRGAAGNVQVDLAVGTAAGAAGNDLIEGFAGVMAGDGDDSIVGDAANNYFDAGAGDDSIDGGAGFDRLSFVLASGGVVASLADGESSGAAGSDHFTHIEALRGSEFADELSGSAGDDVLEGRDGADTLAGAAGADRLHGGYGADLLVGGADADTLLGDLGNDILQGGSGRDLLDGGAGADRLDGGGGIDAARFAATRAQATVTNSPFGLFVVTPADGTDNLRDVERLLFSDRAVALDVDAAAAGAGMGHAGMAAKTIGALFGAAGLADAARVGQMLAQLDGGMSYAELVAAWVVNPTFIVAAGGGNGQLSAAAFVTQLYRNLVGVAPDDASLAFFVGLLDNGDLTRDQLAGIAAEHPATAAAINLAGLAQSGLEYIPG